jgi:hypothetical protein
MNKVDMFCSECKTVDTTYVIGRNGNQYCQTCHDNSMVPVKCKNCDVFLRMKSAYGTELITFDGCDICTTCKMNSCIMCHDPNPKSSITAFFLEHKRPLCLSCINKRFKCITTLTEIYNLFQVKNLRIWKTVFVGFNYA